MSFFVFIAYNDKANTMATVINAASNTIAGFTYALIYANMQLSEIVNKNNKI